MGRKMGRGMGRKMGRGIRKMKHNYATRVRQINMERLGKRMKCTGVGQVLDCRDKRNSCSLIHIYLYTIQRFQNITFKTFFKRKIDEMPSFSHTPSLSRGHRGCNRVYTIHNNNKVGGGGEGEGLDWTGHCITQHHPHPHTHSQSPKRATSSSARGSFSAVDWDTCHKCPGTAV